MKIRILFFALWITTIGFSQSTINSFYGDNNTNFLMLTSGTPLDHSPAGPNQTWNFNQMISLGSSVHTYASPSVQELATYPGTTTNIISANTQGANVATGYLYTKNVGGVVSITGLNTTGLNANFVTNNATIGTFPMNYGYTTTDSNVAGNYTYTTYSGTFTGTLTTTVDSYGTLTLNDAGNGGYSGNVTRMKNVLSLTLNYGFIPNVGTVVQTSYSYFDPNISTTDYVFRSVSTTSVIPLMSINQTDAVIEKIHTTPLSVDNQNFGNALWIINPVTTSLEINSNYAIENATISITDVSGKTVFTSTDQNINGSIEIPLNLSNGVYFLTIKNEKESITKKIVKG